MEMTVKNVHTATVGVHTARGHQFIAPGQELTAEFSEAEAKNMQTNSLLEVAGAAKGKKKSDAAE